MSTRVLPLQHQLKMIELFLRVCETSIHIYICENEKLDIQNILGGNEVEIQYGRQSFEFHRALNILLRILFGS